MTHYPIKCWPSFQTHAFLKGTLDCLILFFINKNFFFQFYYYSALVSILHSGNVKQKNAVVLEDSKSQSTLFIFDLILENKKKRKKPCRIFTAMQSQALRLGKALRHFNQLTPSPTSLPIPLTGFKRRRIKQTHKITVVVWKRLYSTYTLSE